MKTTLYQIDAFAEKVFSGNPAAVCPLESWLEDSVLQNIALENNLSETAFFVKTEDGFHIRWFTPKAEVDLCGHATLAAGFVLFQILHHPGTAVSFASRSGILTVTRNGDWLTLNFPIDKVEKVEITPELASCFDKTALEAYRGLADFMVVFRNQSDIEGIQPDFFRIARFKNRGIIVTARGKDVDFVSRYFAPAFGINEDPATGSAHTTLTPYWSRQLGKTTLTARQLSERGAYLKCTLLGDRVEISGQAVHYMTGEITI